MRSCLEDNFDELFDPLQMMTTESKLFLSDVYLHIFLKLLELQRTKQSPKQQAYLY